MSKIRSVSDLDLKGKRVFLRLDLNVPMHKTANGMVIEDDTRIRESLPTIKHCFDQGAKLILCSHLGRPDGKRNPEFSLEPVAARLSQLLEKDVILSEESIGDGLKMMLQNTNKPEIILLENIRYYPEEEVNDPEFSRRLSELADVYVSDAFGTAHRKHASTYGLPSLMNVCASGFLIDKELKFLNQLLEQPSHPYVLVLGGAKVTDKLKTVENLLNYVDRVVIGGAMSYAFLAALGKSIGKSKCEVEGIAAAEKILARAESKKVEILLPVDHLVVTPHLDPEWKNITSVDVIGKDQMALDIGPSTIENFKKKIMDAKSVFWNGPMGFFEKPDFSEGTRVIGETISQAKGNRVAGGGDTLSAVSTFKLENGFDLLSTGGGATLKYLEGRGLPGIEVLRRP